MSEELGGTRHGKMGDKFWLYCVELLRVFSLMNLPLPTWPRACVDRVESGQQDQVGGGSAPLPCPKASLLKISLRSPARAHFLHCRHQQTVAWARHCPWHMGGMSIPAC